MSTIAYRFIEPLDVLFLRGNKLFGDAGSFGESLIPPWPSVAAGAIRSRMLADDQVDLAAFSKGEINHPTLGTPQQPGSFSIAAFHLARRKADQSLELLFSPPADLVITEEDSKPAASTLKPQPPAAGILCSSPLALLPMLAQGNKRSKPAAGYWLTQAGWSKYLQGEVPLTSELVKSAELWKIDARVGIGMEGNTRTAREGSLFTTQAVTFSEGVGFVAGIQGAEPPATGLLRFGGDGRAAAIEAAELTLPEPDYSTILATRRCRLVLTSPGLFPQGWQLPGLEGQRIEFNGIMARVAAAAIAQAETISGWDLANWKPKAAQRVAPTGSVYWLDELEATPEALQKLTNGGLWSESCEDTARRAEGFNRFTLAAWERT